MPILKNLKKSTKILTIPSLMAGILLSACGRSSGPVELLGDITFVYKSKDNSSSTATSKEYKMKGNIGNPYDDSRAQYESGNGKYLEINKIGNKEERLKALFFGKIANAALKYQINAINSRSNLLRTYFHYLENNCADNHNGSCRTIVVTEKNDLKTYFGDDDQNKNLFNGTTRKKRSSSSSNASTKIDDYFFAFFLSNSLRQGDGFSSYYDALEFKIKKVIFDLGDISDITFTSTNNNGDFPTYEDKNTGGASGGGGGSSNSSQKQTKIEKFSLNVNGSSGSSTQKNFLKIPVPKIYYSYGFRPKGGVEINKDSIKKYLQDPANSKLIPLKLQNKIDSLTSLDFLVEMAPIAMIAELNDPNGNTSQKSSTNQKSNITNLYSEGLIWNNLTEGDSAKKIYDQSLIHLSKLLDYNLSNGLSLRQNHFDNYIEYSHKFPNNQKVSNYLTDHKYFANNTTGNSFDWKKIRNNKISNLLFSFFSDFKFDSEYESISYNSGSSGSSSSSSSWITLKKSDVIINELKNNSSTSGSNQKT